jgi:2-polyprenyl-3-methyl-5-hydroxy-6-metoxy-1,4-benzoquinol methylase
MSGQVEYYDRFGKKFASRILDCPEPELWTTDYEEKGRVFREMEQRLGIQKTFFDKYFTSNEIVLDIGCGFGRQAAWLGKKGFTVVGIDSSTVFVKLARDIFGKHGYNGEFHVSNPADFNPGRKFKQLILLDVLEHFSPGKRREFAHRISTWAEKDGILIISLPHVRNRFSSYINNHLLRPLKSSFSYFRTKEEHPYRIPLKQEVVAFFSEQFSLLEFLESGVTDYFIFQKK